MEDSESCVSGKSGSKLATKFKSPLPVSTRGRKGKPPSSVSQSMSVLDLSGKPKPSRRLSIPTKATVTPISEIKSKRSAVPQPQTRTPISSVSRSSNRNKFSILASPSYWLNHIKLSESAAQHSISLAFFKLALQAGCQPLQRMKEELKNYSRKHNLAEFEDTTNQLFERYNIGESFEQMQVSETFSHALEKGSQSLNDHVHSLSTAGTRKLKPKSLNHVGTQVQGPVRDDSKKATPAPRMRSTAVTKSNTSSKSTSVAMGQKTQKPSKENEKHKVKKQEKKSAAEEATADNSLPVDKPLEDNKENTDAPQLGGISMIEN